MLHIGHVSNMSVSGYSDRRLKSWLHQYVVILNIYTFTYHTIDIHIHTHIYMFADEVKIYNKSFNHGIEQIDRSNMLKWSSNWCLYLNTNKCNVLHSGKKNTDCDYFMSIGEVDYKSNNSLLVKYLGVTFDPKLNLSHHIYEITHKAT